MNPIPELLKSILGTVVRNAGTPIIAYLAAKGWITADDGSALLTFIVATLAAVLWGVYNKFNLHAWLQAALILPPNSTLEQAKEEAAK